MGFGSSGVELGLSVVGLSGCLSKHWVGVASLVWQTSWHPVHILQVLTDNAVLTSSILVEPQ